MVLLNLALADGMAGRYVGRGIERDDLIQVARLALVKAVDRYRPGRGTSFVGYAAPTISGEIKRHFRDSGWMVRPPRRLQELGAELNQAEEHLEQQLHRRPSSSEVAAALGADQDQIRAARKAAPCYRALSIDAMAAPTTVLTWPTRGVPRCSTTSAPPSVAIRAGRPQQSRTVRSAASLRRVPNPVGDR